MSASRKLFEEAAAALPLDQAMPDLVRPRTGLHPGLARRIAEADVPDEVKAALLLYIDELDLSHSVSQGIASPTGSYLHAVMHRREGDFWNSKHWLQKAGRHPFLEGFRDFVPSRFVDACEADGGRNDPALVQLQRQEWSLLMTWILGQLDRN